MTTKQSDWKAGASYRVIREGARLRGMLPARAPNGCLYHIGWGRSLAVGEVIVCDGTTMTMGDGVPAVKWRDQNVTTGIRDCIFSPQVGNMFSMVPADGYLEPINPLS